MIRYAKIFSLIPLLGAISVSYAKNLGTVGDIWPIQEENLLTVIDARLQAQFGGKSDAEIQAEVQKRVEENSLRPEPIELVRATENVERSFDPSITVEKDIADHKGHVFVRKGQKVNPFDLMNFNQTLIFINADDSEQVQWAKNFRAETAIRKIILIKGNVREAGELLNEIIYFDQKGVLIKRFGISKVPSIIDQMPNQKLLRIREVAL